MYYRIIDSEIRVSLSVPHYGDELFELIDGNREHLKQWLPWIDSVRQPDDCRVFIVSQLQRFSRGEAVHQTILYRNRIAGVVAFNTIDRANGIGRIGYWLGRQFTGKGIMTRAVKDLMVQGYAYWQLQRVEIRCARENTKSRAIAERLGFTAEGTMRNMELIDGRYHDHVVYGFIHLGGSLPAGG